MWNADVILLKNEEDIITFYSRMQNSSEAKKVMLFWGVADYVILVIY